MVVPESYTTRRIDTSISVGKTWNKKQASVKIIYNFGPARSNASVPFIWNVRFRALFCVADAANDFRNFKSIDRVMCVLWCRFLHAGPPSRHGRTSRDTIQSLSYNQCWWQNRRIVLTNSTSEGCPAAGCYQGTISNIVIARWSSGFRTFCVFVGNWYANCFTVV